MPSKKSSRYKVIKKTLAAISLTCFGAMAVAGQTGVSVWGDEAQEAYNTLLALGATKTEIPEGPTVIIDKITCVQKSNVAACRFTGDPKLSTSEGAGAQRMIKALVGIGVKPKQQDAQTLSVEVLSIECGVLHPADQPNGPTTASCYYNVESISAN